jgi:predicted transcriptional regulator
MYIHHMVRTQLYLDDEVHKRLRELAEQQGRTVSELVREAIARAYGSSHIDRRLDTLEAITGLWRDRKDLGNTDSYVRRLRRDTRQRRNRG